MSKSYEIYFEGTLTITSDEELDDDSALEEAIDILQSDARTWLDKEVSINGAEILSINEE